MSNPKSTLLDGATSCILTLTMSKIDDDPKQPPASRDARPKFSAEVHPHREEPFLERWGVPLALLLGTLFLYMAFRSASLDDFDSYSFALALDHYNLPFQQPHPPGFPLYIALGRGLAYLLGEATVALTTLSALAGAGSVVLVYLLGRAIDPNRRATGVLAALLIAVLPVHWLTAEKALSDAPGLAATLVPLWLWARWIQRKSEGVPWLAALVSGLALGIRPQNALPFLLLAVYLLVHVRRAFHPLSILAAVVGVLAWLIPTALSISPPRPAGSWIDSLVYGLRRYGETIIAHAAHVGRADAITSMSGTLPNLLRSRWLAFAYTVVESTLGLFPGQLGDPEALFIILPAGLLVIPGLLNAGWRRRRIRWLGLWMLGVFLQILGFETLDRPRLLLPMLPPLVLLIAAGWARWQMVRALRVGMMAAAPLFLMRLGLTWAATLAHVPAPPVQATTYIADRYPPETTMVAAAGAYRAVQVELSAYRHAYLYQFDADAVRRWLSDDVAHVVIVDRDQFPHAAIETLSEAGRWVPIEERVFVRDRRAHTQHDHVRVQVLARASTVPPAALVPDGEGCIDIGAETDARYLGAGWFRAESIGGVAARWAGGIPTSTLRITLPADRDYEFRLRGLAYPEGQTVALYAGNRELDRAPLPTQWAIVALSLPAGAINPDGPTTLALVHAVAASPVEVSGVSSSDPRRLTVAYDWLCVGGQ